MKLRTNLLAAMCICLCLTVVLAPAVTSAEEASAASAILGELDGDGDVTSTDARLALQLAVNKIKNENVKFPAAADVDMDGSITSTDARLILQYAVGKISQFPVGGTSIAPPNNETPPDLPDTTAQAAALKRNADNLVFRCAEAAVKSQVETPGGVEILEKTVVDQDEYLRYVVKITFKTAEGAAETVYLLIKVNSEMDGQFSWSHDGDGWNAPISEEDKNGFGWESKPKDWNLDSAPDVEEAITVSLQEIYNDPAKYRNKLVRIVEKLVVGSNNLNRKSYYTCMSTGDGMFDYNSDRIIEVVYDIAPNIEDCQALKAGFNVNTGYPRIAVVGYVRIYSNTPDPYIQAVEVTLP